MEKFSFFPKETNINEKQEKTLSLETLGFSAFVIKNVLEYNELIDLLLNDHSFSLTMKTLNTLPLTQKQINHFILIQAAEASIKKYHSQELPPWLKKFLNKIDWRSVFEVSAFSTPEHFLCLQEETIIQAGKMLNMAGDLSKYKKIVADTIQGYPYPDYWFLLFEHLPWDDSSLEEISGLHPVLIRENLVNYSVFEDLENKPYKDRAVICNFIALAYTDRWDDALKYVDSIQFAEEDESFRAYALELLLIRAPNVFVEKIKLLSSDQLFAFIEYMHGTKKLWGNGYHFLLSLSKYFKPCTKWEEEISSIFPEEVERNQKNMGLIVFFYEIYKLWKILEPFIKEQLLFVPFLDWFVDFELSQKGDYNSINEIKKLSPAFYNKYNYQTLLKKLLLNILKNQPVKAEEWFRRTLWDQQIPHGKHNPHEPLRQAIIEFISDTGTFSFLSELLIINSPERNEMAIEAFKRTLEKHPSQELPPIMEDFVLYDISKNNIANHSINPYLFNELFQIVKKHVLISSYRKESHHNGANLLKAHFPLQTDWEDLFFLGWYLNEHCKNVVSQAIKKYIYLDYKSRLILAATGAEELHSCLFDNLLDDGFSPALILVYLFAENPNLSMIDTWPVLFDCMEKTKASASSAVNAICLNIQSSPFPMDFRKVFTAIYENIFPRERNITLQFLFYVFNKDSKWKVDSRFIRSLFFVKEFIGTMTYEDSLAIPYFHTNLPWHENMQDGVIEVYKKIKMMRKEKPEDKDLRRLFWILLLFMTSEKTVKYFEDIITAEDRVTAITEAFRRLDDLRYKAKLAEPDNHEGDKELEDMPSAFALIVLLESPFEGIKKLLLAFRQLKKPVLQKNLEVKISSPCLSEGKDSSPSWNWLPRLIHLFFKDSNSLSNPLKLRRELAVFMAGHLKKDKKRKRDIKEMEALWQETYIHATAALGINPREQLHCIFEKVMEVTYHDGVRTAAEKAVKKMKAIQGEVQYGSPKRFFLNAWWFLRFAHRISLELEVDKNEALLVKRKEVRE